MDQNISNQNLIDYEAYIIDYIAKKIDNRLLHFCNLLWGEIAW